jgi:hypothetical protein
MSLGHVSHATRVLELRAATIVDDDGRLVIAARIALGVDGPVALERRLAHAVELCRRRPGRVAPRSHRRIVNCRGRHGAAASWCGRATARGLNHVARMRSGALESLARCEMQWRWCMVANLVRLSSQSPSAISEPSAKEGRQSSMVASSKVQSRGLIYHSSWVSYMSGYACHSTQSRVATASTSTTNKLSRSR